MLVFSPSSSHFQNKYFVNFQNPSAQSYYFYSSQVFLQIEPKLSKPPDSKIKKKLKIIIIKEPWYIYLLLKHMEDKFEKDVRAHGRGS